MTWMPENPGMSKNPPACLPGTRVLALAAKRGPTLALPLGDKVSERKMGEVWCKKETVELNSCRIVKA